MIAYYGGLASGTGSLRGATTSVSTWWSAATPTEPRRGMQCSRSDATTPLGGRKRLLIHQDTAGTLFILNAGHLAVSAPSARSRRVEGHRSIGR